MEKKEKTTVTISIPSGINDRIEYAKMKAQWENGGERIQKSDFIAKILDEVLPALPFAESQ